MTELRIQNMIPNSKKSFEISVSSDNINIENLKLPLAVEISVPKAISATDMRFSFLDPQNLPVPSISSNISTLNFPTGNTLTRSASFTLLYCIGSDESPDKNVEIKVPFQEAPYLYLRSSVNILDPGFSKNQTASIFFKTTNNNQTSASMMRIDDFSPISNTPAQYTMVLRYNSILTTGTASIVGAYVTTWPAPVMWYWTKCRTRPLAINSTNPEWRAWSSLPTASFLHSSSAASAYIGGGFAEINGGFNIFTSNTPANTSASQRNASLVVAQSYPEILPFSVNELKATINIRKYLLKNRLENSTYITDFIIPIWRFKSPSDTNFSDWRFAAYRESTTGSFEYFITASLVNFSSPPTNLNTVFPIVKNVINSGIDNIQTISKAVGQSTIYDLLNGKINGTISSSVMVNNNTYASSIPQSYNIYIHRGLKSQDISSLQISFIVARYKKSSLTTWSFDRWMAYYQNSIGENILAGSEICSYTGLNTTTISAQKISGGVTNVLSNI